ncbi:hypothetical protein BDP67DRAFT_510364 [Colletotrichum lupini]|nr:hypothetical protein BDP67DRAFT_510364 [Colletotrichum lupini]
MASRTEVELITKREKKSDQLQQADTYAPNQNGSDLQLRKNPPMTKRRISTQEDEPKARPHTSTGNQESKKTRITPSNAFAAPQTTPKPSSSASGEVAGISRNIPSATESSPPEISRNTSTSQATCLGHGKFSVSTKSGGIWKFPKSKVWVARASKFPVPDHIKLRWPEIKIRLMQDLSHVEDVMIIEQADEKRLAKKAESRRHVSPELRMSGRQNKFFSEFVTISPCIWVLCGSQSCRKKVRQITKGWSYPRNLFDQPIEVQKGSPTSHAKRNLVPLSRLHIDLERMPGLSYMGGFVLHHLEAIPSTLEHRSACGLLCCTTFLKDGKVITQHISRVGGLLKDRFRDYSKNEYPIALTTSHGIFEDLGTDGLDLEALKDDESFGRGDDQSDTEGTTDDDSDSDECSSTESRQHTGNVVQRSSACYHQKLLGERSPDAVAEWLHVSLGEVIGVKFASHVLPERISARLRRPRKPTPGDYALLKPRNLAHFQNISSTEAELEITSYLANDELTEGCLTAVFGADNLSETFLLPGGTTMPLGQETLPVRTVELEAPLAAGTSGTWLTRGSALAGIIVAAYPGQPLALFMTAQDLRGTIVETFPEGRRHFLWRKAATSFLDTVQDLGASSGESGPAPALEKRSHSEKKGHETALTIHRPRSTASSAKIGAIDDSTEKGASSKSSLQFNPSNEPASQHKGPIRPKPDSLSSSAHSVPHDNTARQLSSDNNAQPLLTRQLGTSRSISSSKLRRYTQTWTCVSLEIVKISCCDLF